MCEINCDITSCSVQNNFLRDLTLTHSHPYRWLQSTAFPSRFVPWLKIGNTSVVLPVNKPVMCLFWLYSIDKSIFYLQRLISHSSNFNLILRLCLILIWERTMQLPYFTVDLFGPPCLGKNPLDGGIGSRKKMGRKMRKRDRNRPPGSQTKTY